MSNTKKQAAAWRQSGLQCLKESIELTKQTTSLYPPLTKERATTLRKKGLDLLIQASNAGDKVAMRYLESFEASGIIRLKKARHYGQAGALATLCLLLCFLLWGAKETVQALQVTPHFSHGTTLFKGAPTVSEVAEEPDEVLTDASTLDLWASESLWVLRNALYHYAKDHGVFPENLIALTNAAPLNYLPALPLNPYTQTNEVFPSLTGEGGWVYQPDIVQDALPLETQVAQALNLNSFEREATYRFTPMTLYVSLEDKTLYVADDLFVYHQFPIAVGANQQTPIGAYQIEAKYDAPKPNLPLEQNPYGTRLMELSAEEYAIHGTNTPESINQAVTNGCIRLYNEDVESLYALVSLGTDVVIGESLDSSELNEVQDKASFFNEGQDADLDTMLGVEDALNVIHPTEPMTPTNPPSDPAKNWRG